MVANHALRAAPTQSLVAGALAKVIGTRETLWIAAAGGALAMLWLVRLPLPRPAGAAEGPGIVRFPAAATGETTA